MQHHINYSTTNLSPSSKEIAPSGDSIFKNESHTSPAGTSEDATGSNQKCASLSESLHSRFCFRSTSAKAIQTLESSGILHQITPGSEIDSFRIVPLTCNCDAIRRYASKIQNASADEISIIHLSFLVGWNKAEDIAASMGIYSDRPLRKLLTQAS